jgi:hypothetical protein
MTEPVPPGAPALYLLHGMKRSGNHAITQWLLPQLDCAYFNNLIPLGNLLRGRPLPPSRPLPRWRQAQESARGARLPRLLVSLEDHPLGLMPFHDLDVPLHRLLVVRNARQVFSSRIRKAFQVEMPAYPRGNDAVMQRAVGLWKQHARCFLGDTGDYPGRVAILFDAWFADAGYRAAICTALGTRADDRALQQVSGHGGGSSFDGVDYDGRGHQMAVTDRVSQLQAHERELLAELFQDQELAALADAVEAADPRPLLRLD